MDVEKFNNHLKVAPWNIMDTFDKLEYWKSLTLINSIAEKHMPTKKMRFRKVDVPYMTIEWKNKSTEDMILALAGQFKQLSHEPEKFR